MAWEGCKELNYIGIWTQISQPITDMNSFVRKNLSLSSSLSLSLVYICIYIYICLCLCVFVCVWQGNVYKYISSIHYVYIHRYLHIYKYKVLVFFYILNMVGWFSQPCYGNQSRRWKRDFKLAIILLKNWPCIVIVSERRISIYIPMECQNTDPHVRTQTRTHCTETHTLAGFWYLKEVG